jgi:predicted DCC family thiol-disulfide oxidoreductase YuxK
MVVITVFYDGQCPACSGLMGWAVKRMIPGRVLWCSLDVPQVRESIPDSIRNLDTMIVYNHNRSLWIIKYAAVTHIGMQMVWPWRLLAVLLRSIPVQLGDTLYDWIAKNRYRWRSKNRCSC